MNEHTNDHEHYEPTQEDVLIGRVVDQEATPQDWARLDELASDDAELWSRLGRAQRAHAGLRIAVEDAIAGAELVEIPSGRAHGAGRMSPMKRVLAGAGWAVAAALGLALLNPLVTSPSPQGGGFNASMMPTLLSQATPDEAYTHYLASGFADGRVVSEMPTIVLEQNVLPDEGGVELLVVRRIVERRTTPTIENLAYRPDEFGELRLTPVEPRTAIVPVAPSPATSLGIRSENGVSF